MAPVRVLVCDSQRLVGEALAVALSSRRGIDVIMEFPTTGPAALHAARSAQPDVVVLDYWLVGMDGPTTTEAIRAQVPGSKVLLTSSVHGPNQVRAALEAGAAGFLLKSLTLEQLRDVIHRAQAGEDLVFGNELAVLVAGIEARHVEATAQEQRMLSLSARELEILQLLSEGLSAGEVSSDLGIRTGTVKNHIHHILTKLDARSQLEAVAIARHAGVIVGGTRFPGSRSDVR